MRKIYYILLIMMPSMLLSQAVELTFDQAEKLIKLPLHCIETEFPNKLSQTLKDESDMGTPQELHPTFYGCFDWHSAVHGYWSIVNILQRYPELDARDSIKNLLLKNISPTNIAKEIAYFERKHEYSYERTYGWAWLLKLQKSLDHWNDPKGQKMAGHLRPLTDIIVSRYMTYLPKLNYPIRVGTHTNTAFGMSFAYDYALSSGHAEFKDLLVKRAKEFYLEDQYCPLTWEPSGYDFLSPCMEEIDLMRKVLDKDEFMTWIKAFSPGLLDDSFAWEVGEVSDRTDGHLVHLDGLNFSRAWVFYGLATSYQEFDHLIALGDRHFEYSYPNLVGDSYEGGHWLASFALYALTQR